MSKPSIDVVVAPLAYRRAEAAAALGVSLEVFDEHVRPHLPVVRAGSVRVFPIRALEAWLAAAAISPTDDLRSRVA